MVAITVANLAARSLARRLSPRRAIAAGSLAMGCGCAGLLGVGASTSYASIVVQISTVGAGVGLIVPVITAEVLRSVEHQRSGVAAGTLNTMRQGGSAIGVAVFGSQIAAGFASGFRIVLVISIGLAVAIGVALRSCSRRERLATS